MSAFAVRRTVWLACGMLAASVTTLGLLGCVNPVGLPPNTQVVTMTSQDQYQPRDIQVSPGQLVVWNNADSDLHTVTSDPLDPVAGGPNSATVYPNGMPSGTTYHWTVPTNAASGTVWYYHCQFHGQAGNGTSLGSGMAGSITVK